MGRGAGKPVEDSDCSEARDVPKRGAGGAESKEVTGNDGAQTPVDLAEGKVESGLEGCGCPGDLFVEVVVDG